LFPVKEAVELTRLAVNKTIVSERKGRDRKGYGRLAALRLLVYALLVGIDKDEPLEKHLRRNRGIARALGFKRSIPDRTTIGRWKKKLDKIAREAFEKQTGIVEMLAQAELLVVDSTPLEDWRDPEAEWGYYSRGPFKGFKVHVSVDQLGLPRKAVVTPGNGYDSPFLPELIQGLRPKDVIGDAAYDAESNRKACREIGAKPHIATNPRRSGRRRYTPPLCKRKRYIVEQFNSRFKEMLGECWLWFKGLAKKATMVYSALLAMNALALQALLMSMPELLRKIGVYRY
jgi:IS5 family transposase